MLFRSLPVRARSGAVRRFLACPYRKGKVRDMPEVLMACRELGAKAVRRIQGKEEWLEATCRAARLFSMCRRSSETNPTSYCAPIRDAGPVPARAGTCAQWGRSREKKGHAMSRLFYTERGRVSLCIVRKRGHLGHWSKYGSSRLCPCRKDTGRWGGGQGFSASF